MPNVGDRIRDRRMMLKMTQEELAVKVGYKSKNKKSTINKIEKGINDLRRSKVTLYAQALQTSEAYLMGWVDDPELTHEETLRLEKQDKIRVIAADTASLPSAIFHMDETDTTQHHKKMIAERIINSNYSDEELNKIEQMLDIIVPIKK